MQPNSWNHVLLRRGRPLLSTTTALLFRLFLVCFTFTLESSLVQAEDSKADEANVRALVRQLENRKVGDSRSR